MLEINENPKTPSCDSGVLLEAKDAELVTLVAGETQMAVHRSVLMAKSPVLAAMLAHDTVEAGGGRIAVADVEPEVLHELLLFMYKDSAPQLCSMAPQLLVAADKYGVHELKAQCELQLLQDLSVENIVKTASIALRHSCSNLKDVAACFLRANLTRVMATDTWAEAVRNQPEEFLEVCHLLAPPRCESQEGLNQLLLKASQSYGSLEEVRKLLARGADVGARDGNGRTALHYAARRGCTRTTEGLLKAGAHVEAKDRWLQTPLYAAVQGNSVEVVKQLVAASAEVNTADKYGDTPLHLAAQLGKREMVQALLHLGADKGARNIERETPMGVAERCRRTDLHYLLSCTGSNKNSEVNENPETPSGDSGAPLEVKDAALVTLVAGEMQLAVHKSVFLTRSPVFAAMLAHDTVEASSGRIVITDIEPKVLQQLVLFMYKGSAPQLFSMAPQLLVAADKYCMPELKAQCELQLVRDLSVENVITSALLALRHSCPRLKEAVTCFLQANRTNLQANLTKVMGTKGWAEAVHNHADEFVELSRLVAATPPNTSRNASQEELDRKLLKTVVISGSTEAQELLTKGADVGAQDESGRTALHYAAASGNKNTVDHLLYAGAHVNAKDRWLQTPLSAAIQSNSFTVVERLLDVSSDTNTADVYGCTPLHLAAQWGDTYVVKALLKADADKSAMNYRKERPVDVAKRFKKESLLTVLSEEEENK